MTSGLMLGDTDIGNYIKEIQLQENEPELDVIIDRLKSLEEVMENALPAEKLPLEEEHKRLYHKLISSEYPSIDVIFLGMSSTLKIEVEKLIGYNNYEIKVPRFSVYPLYGRNSFSIELGASREIGDSEVQVTMNKKIPEVIRESLLKSFEFSDFPKGDSGVYNDNARNNFRNVPREIRRKYYDWPNLTSQFNGIIPEETKRSVEEATKYFSRNNILTIAETKPEEWSVTHLISSDPIVVGVSKYDGCFLIDHFNTTPLEDLVKNNFLNIKKN